MLGVTAPLSPDLLRAAAVDYCNRRDQARAGANWFEDALAFATEPLHGGVSALEPNAHGMGEITGYTIADYIQQHAQSERNGKYLPSSAWQAILDYCHDLPSIIAAAKAAVSCGLQVVATQFYRRAADAGENSGDYPLISLLAEQGRVDEAVSILQAQAHADFSYSLIASDLADMLANQDRVDDALSLLRARADAGDHSCASNLIDLLTKHGRVEELRARVHAGHRSAIFALVDLLVEQGNTEEAVAVLRAHTDVGTGYVRRLADLLAKQGHVDDAVSVLRASADAGNSHVGEWLVELLVEHGRTDEVRTRADLGDAAAARWLAGVLIEQGSTHEAASMLRANADTHYDLEAWQLIEKMIEQGSLDEAASVLQARVNAGDGYAVLRLPDLLAKQGNMDEAVSSLQDRADAGDLTAAHALAALLIRHGRAGDAESVLRRSAEAGDSYAALQLTYLLVEQGRIDGDSVHAAGPRRRWRPRSR